MVNDLENLAKKEKRKFLFRSFMSSSESVQKMVPLGSHYVVVHSTTGGMYPDFRETYNEKIKQREIFYF